MAGGTHDRFDNAGDTDLFDRLIEFFAGGGKAVGRGRQAQFFGGQPADAFAVHRQFGSPGGGDHMVAFGFEFQQRIGGDRFDFRHDEIGFFCFDHPAQFRFVQHIDGVTAVRHLHPGRIGVAVNGNGFHAEPLHGNDDFFAEFAGTAEKDLGGRRGERSSDFHEIPPLGDWFYGLRSASRRRSQTVSKMGLNN